MLKSARNVKNTRIKTPICKIKCTIFTPRIKREKDTKIPIVSCWLKNKERKSLHIERPKGLVHIGSRVGVLGIEAIKREKARDNIKVRRKVANNPTHLSALMILSLDS